MADFRRYAPTPGALPWRILSYFAEFPDAELTRQQIFKDYGITRLDGLDGILGVAVAKQAIAKKRGTDGDMRWYRGPNPLVELAGLDVKVDDPEAEELPDDEPAASDPFGQARYFSVRDIPILKQTPLDPEKRFAHELKEWLNALEVGDSAEFDRWKLNFMRREVERHTKGSGKRFRFCEIKADKAGLERVE